MNRNYDIVRGASDSAFHRVRLYPTGVQARSTKHPSRRVHPTYSKLGVVTCGGRGICVPYFQREARPALASGYLGSSGRRGRAIICGGARRPVATRRKKRAARPQSFVILGCRRKELEEEDPARATLPSFACGSHQGAPKARPRGHGGIAARPAAGVRRVRSTPPLQAQQNRGCAARSRGVPVRRGFSAPSMAAV